MRLSRERRRAPQAGWSQNGVGLRDGSSNFRKKGRVQRSVKARACTPRPRALTEVSGFKKCPITYEVEGRKRARLPVQGSL